MTETDYPDICVQEAAQALIYAGMAGSKLDGIQDKVNEYLDRVEALHNASKERERAVSFHCLISLHVTNSTQQMIRVQC